MQRRTGSIASVTGARAVLTMWPPGSSCAAKAHWGAGTPSTATRAATAGAVAAEPAGTVPCCARIACSAMQVNHTACFDEMLSAPEPTLGSGYATERSLTDRPCYDRGSGRPGPVLSTRSCHGRKLNGWNRLKHDTAVGSRWPACCGYIQSALSVLYINVNTDGDVGLG